MYLKIGALKLLEIMAFTYLLKIRTVGIITLLRMRLNVPCKENGELWMF